MQDQFTFFSKHSLQLVTLPLREFLETVQQQFLSVLTISVVFQLGERCCFTSQELP